MPNDIAEDALKLRDAALEEVIASVAADSGAAAGEIDDLVRPMFETYFAASQKKREAPDAAVPKIAKIVKKAALKKFPPPAPPEPEPAPEPTPAQAGPVGQVTGKTAGIDRKMMNILMAVSAHYGTPVQIVSGQRSEAQQAQALYTNWQSHLRRGKDNAHLARAEKLRVELDKLKQDKNIEKFIEVLRKKADFSKLSKHLSGEEVDLAASTDPAIVAALATCLNHRAGRNSEGARVHHFDTSKTVWPITESTRAKWQPMAEN